MEGVGSDLAASMCEVLYVMISWCEGRESTSKELLHCYGLNYHSIDGDYLHRFTEAKRLIRENLNITTQW